MNTLKAALLMGAFLPSLSFALGYGDPVFVSSTMLTNTFPMKEMKEKILQLKISPIRFQLDASKEHAEDPSTAKGWGGLMSAVYTVKDTETTHYGFGTSMGYFSGRGSSLMMLASSPLENFLGDHKVSGFFSSFTANMDPTVKVDWFNLPMFAGFSFQVLKTSTSGTFSSVNRDGAVTANPFGVVTANQTSDFTGFGFYAGIGPQFIVHEKWLMITPFTMISIPFSKPKESTTLTDERFRARLVSHDTTTFIPVSGVELGIPNTSISFLWVPNVLKHGASVYTLSFSREIEI